MMILGFFLGLGLGLVLWIWQRSRSESRIRALVRKLGSLDGMDGVAGSIDGSLSSTSQLGLAIAQRQEIMYGLEQQLHTYRQILQTAPVGYLQVDDENRLVAWNNQAMRLLGIAEGTSVTQPRLLLEVVRSYELDDLIEQARHADRLCQDDWMFYSVSDDPVRLSEQQSYALRGYAFPLVERQVGIFLENRQETLTLTQQRDRWAADLAHELKTPLTSIRLVAETLQTRVEPGLKSWIDRLIKETIRLSTLVQDLLDLNQMDRTPAQKLKRQTVNLVDLIDSVWHGLEPLARRKNLRMIYTGPPQVGMAVDSDRIYRLLINLLDNSIKFSPAGQAIQVKVQVEPLAIPSVRPTPDAMQEVCLEVIDCGDGFPESALPHVFERFYQADPSRVRQEVWPDSNLASNLATEVRPNGNGLGLAIARQIVEIHQGSITASNHPETGGAWLRVRLPLSEVGALK